MTLDDIQLYSNTLSSKATPQKYHKLLLLLLNDLKLDFLHICIYLYHLYYFFIYLIIIIIIVIIVIFVFILVYGNVFIMVFNFMFGLHKYSFYFLFFFAKQCNQPFLFVLQLFPTWWQHMFILQHKVGQNVSDEEITFSGLLLLLFFFFLEKKIAQHRSHFTIDMTLSRADCLSSTL